MAEYVTKEQIIDWFRPYGHLDKPIPFETLVSDLRGMKAADVEPVQEWISVNDERKPKEGEDVLVAVFDGYDTYTDIDCLMRNGKWCFETENYKVTHWMEKPKPPKGE